MSAVCTMNRCDDCQVRFVILEVVQNYLTCHSWDAAGGKAFKTFANFTSTCHTNYLLFLLFYFSVLYHASHLAEELKNDIFFQLPLNRIL